MNQILIPPVAQQTPASYTSSKYLTIPSTRIVDAALSEGLVLVEQKFFGTRKPSPHGRHLLKFRFQDDDVRLGEDYPEIIVVNSHDAGSSLRMAGGIFRLICENGLVIGDTWGDSAFRHRVGKLSLDDIVERFVQLSRGFVGTLDQVHNMKITQLGETERMSLAAEALSLRWPDEPTAFPENVLVPHRKEDEGYDLWSTYNVLQENLIKGFQANSPSTGRTRRAKPIRNVDNNLWINRKLWDLSVQYINA